MMEHKAPVLIALHILGHPARHDLVKNVNPRDKRRIRKRGRARLHAQQFERLYKELIAKGDRSKLMDLFVH
jgi:hypothetical protein